jgi:hypothetical protein
MGIDQRVGGEGSSVYYGSRQGLSDVDVTAATRFRVVRCMSLGADKILPIARIGSRLMRYHAHCWVKCSSEAQRTWRVPSPTSLRHDDVEVQSSICRGSLVLSCLGLYGGCSCTTSEKWIVLSTFVEAPSQVLGRLFGRGHEYGGHLNQPIRRCWSVLFNGYGLTPDDTRTNVF